MAILKCKMCGGDLNIIEGVSTAECEYCGSVQTVPKVDDEKKLNLFARANRLRATCEFDKAAGIYEAIIADFPEEAEAYWGLVLCNYGIEYVDDPATGKKIPTCHRSGFESVMKDTNVELAQEYADVMARRLYREEAKQIEELRKGIIAVSASEAPHDVFICYKETDFNGKRTLDSVLAQDIYDALTDKGYRVFFSRISLEDKLGTEYEPYIFAALNSAKIMLVIGTDFEYFNAVWVKNEWSRFLKLMAQDKQKHLIPCYKGIDAYDMPEEFSRLQAQDLDKMGAIQDIVRGVQKLLPKQPETVKETVVVQQASANLEAMLKRAFMFLEDGEWEKADDFCEQVLNHDPENAMAYLGKLMAELKVTKQEALKNHAEPFSDNSNYQKAIRFGNDQLKLQLQGDVAHIKMRNENAHKDAIYKDAMEKMDCASITSCKEAISLFQSISGWKDADNQAAICEQKILKLQELKKNSIYTSAVNKMCSKKSSDIQEAIELFRSISGWKDTDEKVVLCQKQKKELDAQELIAKAKQQEQEQISRKLWEEEQQKRLLPIREKLLPAQKLLSAGMRHTVGLMVGGKAVAVGCNWGDRCDVYCLKDIVAVATGAEFTILLIADGTVQIRGDNRNNNYHTDNWSDIVAVAGGEEHAVGLKADGTVVATGDDTRGQCDVSGWTDIIAISAGTFHTVGLKSNGTVVSTHKNTNNWQDIVAVAAGGGNTIGLKSNGTIVTTDPILDKSWSEIVAISAGFGHVVGLKSDGTVVAAGMNKDLQCKVNGWANIVAVSAGRLHTVGLKSDGTLVATGWNEHRQCDVSEWKLFNNYDNLKTENKEATTQKWKIRGRCQHCGGELKGFFSKKCISCGKPKDY